MSESVSFTVPLVPPSVNSYVRHTRGGKHYVTKEAKAFKEAVVLLARGAKIRSEMYRVEVQIYLGKADRGDLDNFLKVALDSLVDAGVIHSDAAITELKVRKDRDWLKPRTVFLVETL